MKPVTHCTVLNQEGQSPSVSRNFSQKQLGWHGACIPNDSHPNVFLGPGC